MKNRGSYHLSLLLLMFAVSACGQIRAVEDMISALVSSCNTASIDGEGTADNPFVACTPDQMRQMEGSSDHWVLGQDIDLTDETTYAPIAGFNGVLDGKGYAVIGQKYYDASANYVALFDEFNSGVKISNLKIKDSVIEGGDNVSALVGSVLDTTGIPTELSNITIENATVIGKSVVGVLFGNGDTVTVDNLKISGARVAGEMNTGLVGGISSMNLILTKAQVEGQLNISYLSGGAFGYVTGATVDQLVVYSHIYSNQDTDSFPFMNQGYIGGIFGYASMSVLTNSTFIGSLTSSVNTISSFGGIAGATDNSMFLANAVNARTIYAAAGSQLDGFVGSDWGGVIEIGNYVFNHANTYSDNNFNTTAMSYAESRTESSYVAFDFDDIWTMSNGNFKLPILKSMNATKPFDDADYRQNALGELWVEETEDPSGLSFPLTTNEQFSYAEFTLHNDTGVPIYLKSIDMALNRSFMIASDMAAAPCQDKIIAGTPLYSGFTCVFRIRFNPYELFADGIQRDLVIIGYTINSSSGILHYLNQKVDGEGQMILPSIANGTLGFADLIDIGDPVTQDYTLTNIGASDGEIVSFTMSGSVFTLDDTDCPVGTILTSSGGTCDLHIEFDSAGVASYSETLEVVYRDTVTAVERTMTLTITGDGIEHPFNDDPATACQLADGSALKPFCVYNAIELAKIKDFASYNFKQTADIDLGGAATPFTPIAGFSGTYDGAGGSTCAYGGGTRCAITNLYYHGPDMFIGLFATSSGTISNVILTNVDLASTAASIAVGGLVGSHSGGTISNIRVTGTITGNINTLNYGYGVGGIIGYMGSGTLTQSHVNATVTSTNLLAGGLIGLIGGGTINQSFVTGAVNGARYVGGLVGYLVGFPNPYNAFVYNSWTTAVVTSSGPDVGGLIGYSNGYVENSYVANTTVSGTGGVGAIAGINVGGAYTNTYYQSGIQNDNGLGTALTVPDLSLTANFTGFDFTPVTGIWTMPVTNNAPAGTIAPALTWQCTDFFAPINCL